jgi:ribokinase
MRVAVVGHVEWVEFLRVPRVPAQGEILQARDAWCDAAGGGGVAAVQLARLAGEALLITALGDDDLGHRCEEALQARGVRVAAARRAAPQRRAVTFLDDGGERTITVVGERLEPHGDDDLPWEELAGMDAVYLTAGDPAAVRAARRANVLVATPRAREGLRDAGVELDALVRSAGDSGERYLDGDLVPPPRLVVSTAGRAGGTWQDSAGRTGSWPAVELPGPVADSYGAGDSFAAGLTYGLGAGLELPAAVELAARCGAACVTGAGPYAGQLAAPGGRQGP